MTALAIAAVVIGAIPFLVGATYLFVNDPAAFVFAFGMLVLLCGALFSIMWGVMYLRGAS